jgi:hypothetical protein
LAVSFSLIAGLFFRELSQPGKPFRIGYID